MNARGAARRRPLAVVAAGLVTLGAAGALADMAVAGCGGVQVRRATTPLRSGPPPLVVGDSVLLGAMPQVARVGLQIDAHGCRGWGEGLGVLRARRRASTLPKAVVMMLGTNYGITRASIRAAMAIVGRHRALIVLTPREVFGEEGADAAAVRAAGRAFPERLLVLDWAKHTRSRGSWFQPDGIHLTAQGAVGLARFLRAVTPFAGGIPAFERGARQEGRVTTPLS